MTVDLPPADPLDAGLTAGFARPAPPLARAIAPRTADRVGAFARSWLHQELADTAALPEKLKKLV